MSDLRFKIEGDSGPFRTDICVLGSSTVVASKVFEYSGITTVDYCNHTCAIIGGLSENTQYTVGVTDSIGNIVSFVSDTTPTNPIVIPIELNVDLQGTYSCPAMGVEVVSGVKELGFYPSLSFGQSVCVTLSGGTSHSNSGDYSEIILYCKPNGSSSYIKTTTITNSSCQTSICVNEGDSVCYTMQTAITYPLDVQEYSFAKSSLHLTNVTPISGFGSCCNITCGPQTQLNLNKTCCVTTTTTTTTTPPISVFFDDILTDLGISNNFQAATLSTVPTLTAGQSVRVCFYAKDYYQYENFLPRAIGMNASATCSGVERCSVCLTSSSAAGPVANSVDGSFYFDVNCTNINNLSFKVNVVDREINSNSTHCAYSCMCVCGLTNMVGGAYCSPPAIKRIVIYSHGSGSGIEYLQ